MKRGSFFIRNSRGQVAVFIIAAVLIIGLAVLIYLMRPGAQATVEFEEQNPKGFIQSCLENKIAETVELVSLNGGSVNPQNYIRYNSTNVGYLCYNSEDYKLCSIQIPFLKTHIEDEIKNAIQEDVADCFGDLRRSYEGRGYEAVLEGSAEQTRVELLPERILITFDYILTAKKVETERYEDFNVVLNNNLYELVGISNSIIDYESTYGDSTPGLYMALYPDLKVERLVQDEGSKVYVLTDRKAKTKFQFASRSLVWGSGLSVGGVATN